MYDDWDIWTSFATLKVSVNVPGLRTRNTSRRETLFQLDHIGPCRRKLYDLFISRLIFGF